MAIGEAAGKGKEFSSSGNGRRESDESVDDSGPRRRFRTVGGIVSESLSNSREGAGGESSKSRSMG